MVGILALACNSLSGAALRNLGMIHLARISARGTQNGFANDQDQALRWLSLAVSTRPCDPNALTSLGVLYWRLGDYASAVTTLSSALALNSNDVVRYHLGAAYAGLGGYELALDTWSQVHGWLFFYIQGRAYEEAEDWERAILMYRTAVRIDASNSEVRARLGHALFRGGYATSEAIAELEKALEIDPTNIYANLYLGEIYEKQQLFVEARKLYQRMRQQNPTDPIGYTALGRNLLLDHQCALAVAELTRSLELNPGDYHVLYLRGLAYSCLKEHARAIQDLEQAVSRMPNRVQYRLVLAGEYLKVGWRDKAIAEYRRVLELDPANQQAREGLSK